MTVEHSDIPAEEAVLAHCILTGTVDAVSDILSAEHFYSKPHSYIWTALLEMGATGSVVDIVTLRSHLEASGQLGPAGGIAELVHIADSPAISNPEAYANSIIEKWRLRQAKRFLAIASAESEGAKESVQDWLDSLAQRAATLSLGDSKDETGGTLGAILEAGWRDVEARARGIGSIAIPTGLRDLDGVLGGWYPGELIVLAARPGMGKSGLAGALAANVGRLGFGSMILSLEMPRDQFANRIACSEARVSLSKVRTGKLTPDDWSRLTDATQRLKSIPVYIDDHPHLKPSQLRSKVRKRMVEWSMAGYKPGLVIIDYLQLMGFPEDMPKGMNQADAIGEITKSLKIMAKEFKIPVLVLSQLNRGVESRDDKRPFLSDLRSSGSIEQDADTVMLLYRDEYYNENTDAKGQCEIILAKHRNGPVGTVVVGFDSEFLRFRDWS